GLARAPVALCWNTYMHDRRESGRVLEGNVYDTILDGMAPHMGKVVLERTLAPKLDERFTACEDIEWWLRLAKSAPVATVPRVGYLVRQHDELRHVTGYPERVRGRL